LEAVGGNTVEARVEAEIAAEGKARVLGALVALTGIAADAGEPRHTAIEADDDRAGGDVAREYRAGYLGLGGAREAEDGRQRGSAGQKKLSHRKDTLRL
jgi:hypothetical protein